MNFAMHTSLNCKNQANIEVMNRYLIFYIILSMSFYRYWSVSAAGLPSVELVQAAANNSWHMAEEQIIQSQPTTTAEILYGFAMKNKTLSQPTTPDEILHGFAMKDKTENMVPKFTEMNEFASSSSGGQIIFATDDYFAVAENIIKDSQPVFFEDKVTDYGKWMDGWETRRKRIPGHDWAIIELVGPCNIKGILVDTAFFTGNFAPRISVQGGNLTENETSLLPHRRNRLGTASSNKEIQSISKLGTELWPEIIAMTHLKPGNEETRKNYLSVSSNDVFSFIRVNIYPDAGFARLRVFGNGAPDLSKFSDSDVFDLIAMVNGGAIVSFSNAYFSHPRNLIKKGRATKSGDGWETARRLDRPPVLEEDSNGNLKVFGREWTVIKMSCSGIVDEILIDSLYFKGNAPNSVRIEGTILSSGSEKALASAKWATILNNEKLSASDEHIYKSDKFRAAGPFNYVKITIFPDGGMSRFRMFGRKVV